MINELLDAFNYGTSLIDKAGPRPLRGLLAGKPREALSFLPFSDASGITDPRDVQTGRNVTDKWGLTNPTDPGWGAWGAGLAADVALDPLALYGGVKAGLKGLSGLHHGLLGTARQAARHPQLNMGIPFPPADVYRLTGRLPEHLGFEEAAAAYDPWFKSLHPEEQTALKAYTSGPQGRISHALRGNAAVGGDPFEEEIISSMKGMPFLKSPGDVHQEVVPYLDSALSRAQAPKDLMTYRVADRIGGVTPETAKSMVGQTVSDPSYLSTTITPWQRFYGQSGSPKDLLLDILIPKHGSGGYAEPLSVWKGEQELILPRQAPLRVAGVQQQPVKNIGHDWFRLDAAGKPIPKHQYSGNPLFNDEALNNARPDILKQGIFGDVVIPEEVMAPDWREFLARNTKGEGQQTNVLLEMLSSQTPHQPGVHRLTPQEIVQELMRRAQEFDPAEGKVIVPKYRAAEPPQQQIVKMINNLVKRQTDQGLYPSPDELGNLARYGGIKTDDLLRSRPGSRILEAFK